MTHDQEEALAISDRICVMNGGRIEQIGTPQEIYGDPQTLFVAQFVGIINTLQPGAELSRLLSELRIEPTGAATWVVRPEHIRVVSDAGGSANLTGTISKFTYLGREAHAQMTTALGSLTVHISDPGMSLNIGSGDTLTLSIERSAIMAFDETGRRVHVKGL